VSKRAALVLAVTIAAIAAAVAIYECQPVFVETAIVRRGAVPRIVRATGTVVARRSTDISAGTMGRVEKILVREGDVVNRGQVVVQLDPVAFRAQVQSVEETLQRALKESESADAALARARRSSERAGALEGERLASEDYRRAVKSDEEAAMSARDTALRSVVEARDRVEAARRELLRAQVVAPVAGRVAAVHARVGETVADGHGPVLLSIAQSGAWDAEVFSDDPFNGEISRGEPVTVSVGAPPGTPVGGSISRVEKDASGRVGVRIELQSARGVFNEGLSAAAAIQTPGRTGVAVVPVRCLLESAAAPGNVSVFVLEQGRARRRQVSIGLRAEGRAEVTAGLRGGESVVAGPSSVLRRLRDGERISSVSGGISRWL
jgi:HlyD family secretion protein